MKILAQVLLILECSVLVHEETKTTRSASFFKEMIEVFV